MAESYIKEYSLLDFVADGYGVEDQPYEINNFYIYGNQSISIKTSGEGMLSFNMRGIEQAVYADNTSYHIISAYINGTLIETDATRLIETKDFNIYIPVSGESEVRIVFAAGEASLTYSDKVEVFLTNSSYFDPDFNIPIEDEEENEPIEAKIPVARLNTVVNCGLYSTSIDNDDVFLLEDGVIYFIGDASITGTYPLNIYNTCLLYTSPSPRDGLLSRMPSSA